MPPEQSPELPPFDVCVIGLGYVGLTLATALADWGMRVLGVEKRPDVVSVLQSGQPHFEEIGLGESLARVMRDGALNVRGAMPATLDARAFVITVGTPLDSQGQANLDMIRDAARQVAAVMRDDALVVLRSTVMVGTSRNIVAPVLESSGRRFHLAMCPERTLQGHAMAELRELPQIVGADTEEARDRAVKLFSRLTHTVLPVSSLETAEVIKLIDNTYRDVCFGFANEVARVCDAVGVNALEVVGVGKLGYQRTNVALPGLVGGPCLEKDPHILMQSAATYGIELDITRAARQVNERQPSETAAFIAGRSRDAGHGANPTVAMMGMAFKGHPETDDLRGAMSLKVLRALEAEMPGAHFRLHDPIVPAEVLAGIDGRMTVAGSIEDALRDVDVVVFTNNHRKFTQMPYETLERLVSPGAIIYDYWNHFSEVTDADFLRRYYLLGNVGQVPP